MQYATVAAPYWEEVWLVGAGPSANNFDFGALRGKTVVAINDMVLRLPFATAVFSADRFWAAKRAAELQQFNGERYLATGTFAPGVSNLERIKAPALSDDPTKVHVMGSSGYGALNLAFLKKAKRIFMLGYDYTKHGQQREWDFWAAAFSSTKEQLKHTEVFVVGSSRIVAFPQVAPEALILN